MKNRVYKAILQFFNFFIFWHHSVNQPPFKNYQSDCYQILYTISTTLWQHGQKKSSQLVKNCRHHEKPRILNNITIFCFFGFWFPVSLGKSNVAQKLSKQSSPKLAHLFYKVLATLSPKIKSIGEKMLILEPNLLRQVNYESLSQWDKQNRIG